MVRTLALSSGHHRVLSVIGRQGSGKTTLGHSFATRLGAARIEVSSLVQEANKELKDLDLAKTAERTKEDPHWLCELILSSIAATKAPAIVLTGVRESNIHPFLKEHRCKVVTVALVADPDVRLDRLLEQKRVASVEQFLKREVAEMQLGLSETFSDTDYAIRTTQTTDPAAEARTALDKMKGLKLWS